MYAYCESNPIMNIDPKGYATFSLGITFEAYLVGGISYSANFVIDDSYNVGLQVSEANVFKKESGVVIGLAGVSLGGSEKVSLADTIYDLEGTGISFDIFTSGKQAIGLSNDLKSSSFDVEISKNDTLTFEPQKNFKITASKTSTLFSFNVKKVVDDISNAISSGAKALWEKITSWF